MIALTLLVAVPLAARARRRNKVMSAK